MGYEMDETVACPIEEMTDQVLLYSRKKRYLEMLNRQEGNLKQYAVEKKHAKMTVQIYAVVVCVATIILLYIVGFNSAMAMAGQGYGWLLFCFLAEGLISTGMVGLIITATWAFSLIQCCVNAPRIFGMNRRRLMDDLDMSMSDKLPQETLALLGKDFLSYSKVNQIYEAYSYMLRTEIARIENRVQELLKLEREEAGRIAEERSLVEMSGEKSRIDWELPKLAPGVMYEEPRQEIDEQVLGGAGMEEPEEYGMHIDLQR